MTFGLFRSGRKCPRVHTCPASSIPIGLEANSEAPARPSAPGGASIAFLDIVLTMFVGGTPRDVLARSVVLIVCVPIVTWFVVGRNTRHSEAREHELQFRQDSLLRNISDLVLVLDGAGTVRHQSASVARTLGYATDDLLGTNVDNLVTAKESPSLVALLADVEPGGMTHIECQVRRRDGQLVAVDVVATKSAAGEHLDDIVLTIHDVSKWKDLEEQLTRRPSTIR